MLEPLWRRQWLHNSANDLRGEGRKNETSVETPQADINERESRVGSK